MHKIADIIASHFALDATELVRIMHETDSFIAGGAALGILLENKPWDDSDLDIFYTSCIDESKANLAALCHKEDDNLHLFDKHLINQGFCRTTLWLNSTTGLLGKKTADIEYKISALNKFIMNITTYFNPDIGRRRVQIITLHPCDKVEFLNAFDLNICKVALVPHRLDLSYTPKGGDNESIGVLSGSKITLDPTVPKQDSCDLCFLHEHVDTINRFQHEFELIQKRKMYVSFPAYPPNLEDRLIKYLMRGFIWIKSPTDQTVIMNGYDDHCVRDMVVFQKCLREHFNCDVLDYDAYVTEYRHRFICDEPCDVDKEINIIQIPLKYELDNHPTGTADNKVPVEYGTGYRYPVAYHAERKAFILKTIQGYINNYEHCPNKFFRILEGYNMFQFILAELDFINSVQFCGHKNFIIATYKKALEYQSTMTPDYLSELTSNEKCIVEQFSKVLAEFISKVSTVKLSLGEFKKYLA